MKKFKSFKIFVDVCRALGHGWTEFVGTSVPKSAVKAADLVERADALFNQSDDRGSTIVLPKVVNGRLVYESPSRFLVSAGNEEIVITIKSHALGDATITASISGEVVFQSREGSWSLAELVKAWESWDGNTVPEASRDWGVNELPDLPMAGHFSRASHLLAGVDDRLFKAVYGAFSTVQSKKSA